MQAEILELAKYRMEKAKECLADAQDAFEEDRWAILLIDRIMLCFMPQEHC